MSRCYVRCRIQLERQLHEEMFTASFRVPWGAVGATRGEAEVEMKLGRQKGKARKDLLAEQDEQREVISRSQGLQAVCMVGA